MNSNRREKARIAVAKGATLLDRKMPNWHQKIDLSRLDLANGEACVLGQLFTGQQSIRRWRTVCLGQHLRMTEVIRKFGWSRWYATGTVCMANYDAGKVILGLSHEATILNGFNANNLYSYRDLDNAWAELIAGRQALDLLDQK